MRAHIFSLRASAQLTFLQRPPSTCRCGGSIRAESAALCGATGVHRVHAFTTHQSVRLPMHSPSMLWTRLPLTTATTARNQNAIKHMSRPACASHRPLGNARARVCEACIALSSALIQHAWQHNTCIYVLRARTSSRIHGAGR